MRVKWKYLDGMFDEEQLEGIDKDIIFDYLSVFKHDDFVFIINGFYYICG